MNRVEVRRFLAVMEFFYGFLFGAAVFGATLIFLIIPDFFLGILLAVCIFAFFIFLLVLVRYCIVRIKITQQALEATLEIRDGQEQILRAMYGSSEYKDDGQIERK